jgi:outer membrane receptor protein involved in Fe transport
LVLAEIEHQGNVQASRRSAPFQGRHSLSQKWTQKWWGELSVNWASAVHNAGLAPLDSHDLRICPSVEKPWLSSAQANVDCNGTPAWWTAGMRVVYQRKKDRRLGLRIDNLLDRKYHTHQSATWSKGITARLDVEVAF